MSDGSGNYIFSNLPPGTYTLTAELEGFSIYKQEGIILRAGVNFQVNAVMKIGAMSETVTVTAESPMLEVTRPSNQLNIDGEFHGRGSGDHRCLPRKPARERSRCDRCWDYHRGYHAAIVRTAQFHHKN